MLPVFIKLSEHETKHPVSVNVAQISCYVRRQGETHVFANGPVFRVCELPSQITALIAEAKRREIESYVDVLFGSEEPDDDEDLNEEGDLRFD